MNKSFLRGLVVAVLVIVPSNFVSALPPHWPQFRGPGARNIVESDSAGRLPDRWSATENVAWKADIPGRGWSSPVVWENRVFLTTVVNLGMSEEPKKGLYFGGNRPKPPDAMHQWLVLCLDLESMLRFLGSRYRNPTRKRGKRLGCSLFNVEHCIWVSSRFPR